MSNTTLALLLLLVAASSPLASASRLKGAKRADLVLTRTPVRRALKGDDGIDVDNILGIGCFSADSTVQVQYQEGPISIQDLRVGDYVLTADREYAPVYAFGHRNPQKMDVFVQIETQGNGNPLQLTAEHLVFLNGRSDPVRADSIQPGHVLNRGGDAAKVIATSLVVKQGVYAPFTTTGTVMVNGLAASSYVSLQTHASGLVELNGWSLLSQHRAIHMGLSPLRMACLGIWSQLCAIQPETGMPSLVSGALEFQEYMERQPKWVQTGVFWVFMALAGACMLMEATFGAGKSPIILVALTLLYWIARALSIQVRCKVMFPSRS